MHDNARSRTAESGSDDFHAVPGQACSPGAVRHLSALAPRPERRGNLRAPALSGSNETVTREIRRLQGFETFTLRTNRVETAVIPQLGARIVSLKDLRTGREWMWHPGDALRLFPNRFGDDFAAGTLAGADECLPTIAPCAWNGRTLPDHGEVWSLPWKIDGAAWEHGALRTSVDLPVSPFRFERTLTLRANRVCLRYRLSNLGPSEERFLWALHPLLRLQPGDELALPSATRALLKNEPWIGRLSSAIPAGGSSKLFAAPLRRGLAAIHNSASTDALAFRWSALENNTLGLWLTRGGWNGHHHVALEPTNGAPDPLADAAARKQCGRLTPGETKQWTLIMEVGVK